MEIKVLEPSGFCFGVQKAYDSIMSIIKKHNNKKIFMIGWLVHDQLVLEKIKEKGVITLEDNDISRIKLIEKTDFKKNDVIIFSAHGTDHNAILLAKTKSDFVYDLSCSFVLKTFETIKKYDKKNYRIVYCGKKEHPESKAALKLSSNIIIIEEAEELKKIYKDCNTLLISQTTFDKKKFETIKLKFINFKSKVVFAKEICNSSDVRQQLVIENENNFDAIIILGDAKSNNANVLYKLAKQCKYRYAFFAASWNDIKKINFSEINKIAIVSSASFDRKNIDKIVLNLLK